MQDLLITAKAVRQRFGGISDMSLWRWTHNDALGFPRPLVINRRKYWRLADLEAFEARQAEGSR